MENLFLNILSLSLSGTIFGLVLLLIHPMTRKCFSKKWNYYIWMLLVLRLLLPVGFGINSFDLSAPVRESESVEDSGAFKTKNSGMETDENEEINKGVLQWNKGESAAADEQISPGQQKAAAGLINYRILSGSGIIWLWGMIIALGIKLINYSRLIKKIRKNSRPITDREITSVAEILAIKLEIGGKIRIYENPQISGPMTIGLFRPRIILPDTEMRKEEISLILHHEMIHIKRKDIWYKWLYQMLLCIHWFNPLLYVIGNRISVDCELSCDEQVVKQLTEQGKRIYGNILLDAAQRNLNLGKSAFSTTFTEGSKTLKERLTGIMQYQKQSGKKLFLSICLLMGLVLLSACSSFRVVTDSIISDNDEDSSDDWFWNSINGIDKSAEPYRMYDEDELVAGEDSSDVWQAYSYRGGDEKIKCSGFHLNGSDSLLIIYTDQEAEIQITSSFQMKKGKFKVVQVTPDGRVLVLNDTGEECITKVSLKEGRNVIKMVGQEANLKNLYVSYSGLNENDFLKIFYSEEEEYAENVLTEVNNGNVDKDKIEKILPYMEEEEVSRLLKAVFDQNVSLSPDELHQFFIYSDGESSGQYLVEAIENDDIKPIDEESIRKILPYLESEHIAACLMSLNKKAFNIDLLRGCMPYLDEEDAEACVLKYMELGNTLTYSDFQYLSNYLDESTTQRLEITIKTD